MSDVKEMAQAPAEAAPAQQPEQTAAPEGKAIEPASVEVSPEEAMRQEAREFMNELKAQEAGAQPKAEEPVKAKPEKEAKKDEDSEDSDSDKDDDDSDDFEEVELEAEDKPTKKKNGRLQRAKRKITELYQAVEKKDSEVFEWQKLANEQHLELQQLRQALSKREALYQEEGFEMDPRMREIEERDREIARLKHQQAVREQELKMQAERAKQMAYERVNQQVERQMATVMNKHGFTGAERDGFLKELAKETKIFGGKVDIEDVAERYVKTQKAIRFYEEQEQRRAQVNASSRAPDPISGRTPPFDPTMGDDNVTTEEAKAFLKSQGLPY